jgi:hypothetical protein
MPPKGVIIDVFCVDVGAPRSPTSPPREGSLSTFFYVDGGRSRISDITSQGLIVDISKIGGGAPRSPSSPPREHTTHHPATR